MLSGRKGGETMQEPNKFELSIAASGMTKAQAQKQMQFKSYQALAERLENPGNFRLKDLLMLRDGMTEQGSAMLMDAIDDFFCVST
jgi:hypothetical protein